MNHSSKPSHSTTNVQDTIKGSQQTKMVFFTIFKLLKFLETITAIIKTTFKQCIRRTKS